MPEHSSTLASLDGGLGALTVRDWQQLLDANRLPNSAAKLSGSVFKATLDRHGRGFDVVLKRVSGRAYIRDFAELCRVHERARSLSETVARTSVRFLGAEPKGRWVAMEYVAGSTLEATLGHAGVESEQRTATCESLLDQVGGFLAALHRIEPDDVGLGLEQPEGGSYRSRLERCWSDPEITRRLPHHHRSPTELLRHLGPSFFRPRAGRLILADSQPKNILVPAPDRVCCIDIDYACGNPAIDLAQFLVGLDRLRLPRVWGQARSAVAAWQQAVVTGYQRSADSAIGMDLVFYYPYVLLQVAEGHATQRPWLRRFLVPFYAGRLHEFLLRLDRLSATELQARPDRLFAERSGETNGRAGFHVEFGCPPMLATAGASQERRRAETSLELAIESNIDCAAAQPVSVGLPFARGVLNDPSLLRLHDAADRPVCVQTTPLATWPDGSVKWLLTDFVADRVPRGVSSWTLATRSPLAPREECRSERSPLAPREDSPSAGIAETACRSPLAEREGYGDAHSEAVHVTECEDAIEVSTSRATFRLPRSGPALVDQAMIAGEKLLAPDALAVVLTDAAGSRRAAETQGWTIEARGPVRATVRTDGHFGDPDSCRFVARCCFFAGTGLVRVRLTIHNPQRARHAGGLWDLGDPGSILFRDLTIAISLIRHVARPLVGRQPEPPQGRELPYAVAWCAEPGGAWQTQDAADLEIYQDSSGGENWQSKNHVNREGRVPCSFRGYRVRAGEKGVGSLLPESRRAGTVAQKSPDPLFVADPSFADGLRANPQVVVRSTAGTVAVAIPEFWQQFPKAIEVAEDRLSVRLFPAQSGDLFELQGGEQKTHTVWLHFASSPHAPREESEQGKVNTWQTADPHAEREGYVERAPAPLDWVHDPIRAHAKPEWYAETQAIDHLAAGEKGVGGLLPESRRAGTGCFAQKVPDPFFSTAVADPRLAALLAEVVDGPSSFVKRREIIDEFGWRNFGEIYADHEATYYTGPKPGVSHYNNQYDVLYGTLLQYVQTGDRRWFELAAPLARHVIDIDIYHTHEDRPAYNGGLFWFTDHYKDAAKATHRTFSRANRPPGESYGGGPGSEHNFTTGLLHYYYLTGDPCAAEAVVCLADWVLQRDDGTETLLGLMDDSPTGLASGSPVSSDHSPGRGGGNSVNALVDGWLLTGRRRYLNKAEAIIRRCIHPSDDVAAQNLLDSEKHWSYSMFLATLARYLAVKVKLDELDDMYAYARASLLTYGEWMALHERPALEHPERLEYPTETWAAHEFRKANVLRSAAEYAAEPRRSEFVCRAGEIVERAWSDLLQFETRTVARSVAILMVEGTHDASFRNRGIGTMPEPRDAAAAREPFVPQRQKVLVELRTPRGLWRALRVVANPLNWPRLVARSSW